MTPAADLRGVEVVRDGRVILGPLDLTVARGRHLAVLGPNGSGKTTLLRLLSTYLHPTRGEVEVVGGRLGRVDVRTLRSRVGIVSAGVVGLLHALGTPRSLVAAALHGATRPAPDPDPEDLARADEALARVGALGLADRVCRTLSQGEWQRVQVARALVAGPELLLLDEPFVGLDLGGRERLLADLDGLMREPTGPTVVVVTHHLEEVPTAVDDALLLRDGRPVAAGACDTALTGATVTEAFGVAVEVGRRDGRWWARVTR